jgi:hypothetical protein
MGLLMPVKKLQPYSKLIKNGFDPSDER